MGLKPAFTERLTDRIIIGFLLLLVVITAYPLIYVVLASVSDGSALLAHSGILLKSYGFHLAAYAKVLENPGILKGYLNTFYIVFASVAVNMSITSLTAYVLSRKQVLWNKVVIFNGAEIMKALFENYTPDIPSEEGLLMRATGSVPHNAEIEVPIIYGDYFYVEALLKLKGETKLFW
ncbi:hypothetical protein EHS13_31090 [Paenibacillus psychroresistens]|uniref:Carbohydrate ABC transporter permease n=1 Tax=Paenibacillus psychroresistens TaxID=1778678 RepID=A0A6B8RSY3_9BACL|nr:hypothetical protein [Paenibacillus psychroresistens]QGQ99007.1 hypothetical protein EHS13_31090 [Paenibacillus psychroresistens]